jgi:hypothetical protein
MRPFLLATLLVLTTAACSGGDHPSASSTASSLPSAAQAALPADLPSSFGEDVAPDDVPPAALIPLKAEVTGNWRATTSAGDAIIVAWEMPGPDPFRLDRGIAVWRRFDDGGAPWRPVWGRAYAAAHAPLQNLSAQIADVTGDGSDDAVIFAETGGSGSCGTTSVVDLATAASVYRSEGCDRSVDPNADPVGLALREAVYRPGDAHCCPSKVRTTVLVDADGTWQPVSVDTTTP